MTRTLVLGTIALLVLSVLLLGGGLATTTPGLLMIALLCTGPLTLLLLGAAVGRASNEFTITRKAARSGQGMKTREINPQTQREPLA